MIFGYIYSSTDAIDISWLIVLTAKAVNTIWMSILVFSFQGSKGASVARNESGINTRQEKSEILHSRVFVSKNHWSHFISNLCSLALSFCVVSLCIASLIHCIVSLLHCFSIALFLYCTISLLHCFFWY